MSFLSDLRLSPAPEPSRAGGLSWLLAAFCFVSSASAQYRLDVWTTDDRLPQNGIRAIHQTPDGYLWLVTFDGLVRFDGIRFTVFNKSNSPGIDSNRFDSLYEDRNGELWLGTQDGGVTRYRHGSFTTFTTLNGLPHNHVRGITGDDAGNLWVLAGDSIMQWQETTGRFIHRRYPEGPEDPLLAASLGRAGWFLGVGPSGDPLLPQRTICHISAPALAVTLADHQRRGRAEWHDLAGDLRWKARQNYERQCGSGERKYSR